MEDKDHQIVFVYGTLKKGQPNEHIMSNPETGKHKYIGPAETVDKFPLFVASKYNIPFMLTEKGTGFRIHGELYEVDNLKVIALDLLEGYPEFYIRNKFPVEKENGEIIEAWIYQLRELDPRLNETKTTIIAKYSDGHGGRFYVRHENCGKNDDLF
jgi:gamma-glutamylaminecyclotransferase